MNRPTLLLTGATGAVGRPLLSALLAADRFSRIHVLARDPSALPGHPALVVHKGNLADPAWNPECIPPVDVVLHGAASTHFRAPTAALDAINHRGAARLLSWAEALPRSPRFIHLSTCCVAGTLTGDIAEQPIPSAPSFVNAYEESKWRAEQRVLASPVGPEIVRLSIVAGDEAEGALVRPGALHTALRWFRRGLLPLVPGEAATRVDLISTDLVSRFLLRLLETPPEPRAIYQLAAGSSALSLGELLDLATELCRAADPRWRRGQVIAPALAPRAAFTAFRESVARSGDLLFNEVLASADSFLPVLLHPKRYDTSAARRIWGGPLPLPVAREFASRVVGQAIATS